MVHERMRLSRRSITAALEKVAAVAIVVGFLFGLLSVVCVPFELHKMAQARDWPSRRGVITLSYARRVSSPGRAPYWRTEIGGTFLDKGEKFWITRVRYGDFRFGGGKARAEEAVATYPAGREVDVYYSPASPSEKILEPFGPPTTMHITLGLGIGFLLVPVGLYMLRKRPAQDRH